MQNCIFKCKIEFDYDNTSFQLDISAEDAIIKLKTCQKVFFMLLCICQGKLEYNKKGKHSVLEC